MSLDSLIKGEIKEFEDLDIDASDVPFDIRDYLRPGNAGEQLLSVNDIGTYLDAGEATRSSSGGYLLEVLSKYRGFRDNILRAIDTDTTLDFDGAWSTANNHFKELVSSMMSIFGENIPAELQEVEQWLDASNNQSRWQRLLEKIGASQSGDQEVNSLDESRDAAKKEALGHLKTIQLMLREQRRRSFMNA